MNELKQRKTENGIDYVLVGETINAELVSSADRAYMEVFVFCRLI